jgi:predicted PurR-regulated permease PerM
MKTKSYLISAGVILLIAIVAWYFSNIITYFILAYVFSLLGAPLNKILEKVKIGKFNLSPSVRALITLLSVWTIILALFAVFIPLIGYEINTLSKVEYNRIAIIFEKPIQYIQNTFYRINSDGMTFSEFIIKKLETIFSPGFFSNIFSTFSALIGNVFIGIFSISFIAFFFLKDSYMFFRIILLMVNDKYDSRVKRAMLITQRLLIRYFIGLLIEMTLVATFIFTGLTIVGIPLKHALVIGLFAGTLNIIPYVGPIIGGILGTIMVMLLNLNMPPDTVLTLISLTALVFLVTQLTDNIVFQPLIYSNSVNAHPLEIFLIIIAAGSIAGIPGMILAVPAYTIIRIFAETFFDNLKIINSLTKKRK